MTTFNPSRFGQSARDLEKSVMALSQLGYTQNGDMLITVGGEIVESPFIKTENTKTMTIAEQLKAARAQLAEARQGASNAVAESADASRVVLQETQKVLKEAQDLRAEVAELTNGGPA